MPSEHAPAGLVGTLMVLLCMFVWAWRRHWQARLRCLHTRVCGFLAGAWRLPFVPIHRAGGNWRWLRRHAIERRRLASISLLCLCAHRLVPMGGYEGPAKTPRGTNGRASKQ